MSETSDVVLQFVKPQQRTEIKPLMKRAHSGYEPDRCRHETCTFQVNATENRITCGDCLAPVEAIEVVKSFWIVNGRVASERMRRYGSASTRNRKRRSRLPGHARRLTRPS